jgi:pyrroloquinoline quinone biosynthesis protein B
MQAIVLGSAAGGGVPQWNCRCPVCSLAWAGDPRVAPRTQSSLAVSPDGEAWLLVNASPDIRRQIETTPALHPGSGLRHSPIGAVLLTNGDVDHVAGLLTLRESQPLDLLATPDILAAISANRVFDVLNPAFVTRREVGLDAPFEPVPGLRATLFPVPGKAPLWLEGAEPVIGEAGESTVGVLLEAGGRRIAYVPGCAGISDDLRRRVDGVDILFFDGTVLEDDDLLRAGVGVKTGWRMGHVPMNGPHGAIAGLAGCEIGRRVFVHINNTNPVLVAGSEERRGVEAAGWTIAHDGLTLHLAPEASAAARRMDQAMNAAPAVVSATSPAPDAETGRLLSPPELEAALRDIGARRYHNLHPFHRLLHDGGLNRDQVRAWALNRYYYQATIPVKDASIVARMDDPGLRRIWRQRIVDHDGDAEGDGGIERWLRLTDGLGFPRAYVVSTRGILPATRFAVEAYVHFVREKSLLEAIASSLTELFAPSIISERVAGMLGSYDFVSKETLAYFDTRMSQAPRDADFALDYVKTHATSPALQEAVLNALRFKCDVLWSQLDALHHAYVDPRLPPPGAWTPGAETSS